MLEDDSEPPSRERIERLVEQIRRYELEERIAREEQTTPKQGLSYGAVLAVSVAAIWYAPKVYEYLSTINLFN